MGRNLPIRPPSLRWLDEGMVYPERFTYLVGFKFVRTKMSDPWIREATYSYSDEITIQCRIYYHGVAKRDRDKHYLVIYKGIYSRGTGEIYQEINLLPERRLGGHYTVDEVVVRVQNDMAFLCKYGNCFVEAFKEVCGEG